MTVAAIFLAIVLTLLLQILNGKRETKGLNKEPPRARGAWPVIGHLHLLGGSELPHKVLGDMAEKYGPIFTVELGVHHALVVSNGEIAKECFTTNDKVFASQPKSKAVELMGYNYAILGLAPYGDYWRQVRKIMMVQVLSLRRVEILGHVRASEVKASIKDIYEAWVKNKENKDNEKSEMVKMEMNQWFGNLVLNVILRIVSGKRFSLGDEEGVRFQNVTRRFLKLLGAFVVSDFIPYFDRFGLGCYEKEMKMIAKEMDTIIGGWLKEHKRERETEQQHKGDQVFMDALISTLEGASKEDFPGFDHDTIIKASCLKTFCEISILETIITAALDTTSATLSWALSLLLNNPKALKTAQNEIDEHVGRERLVEESDLNNLVYLDAIIKETLRLYPAAPLAVPHESLEDCIVSGYNIPKGTRLLVNLWKIHHDPLIWSDPDEFHPERFLRSHKDIDFHGNTFEFLPFGSGRRMCPGIFFALTTLRLTLASLIQQFVLENPSTHPVDMRESPGLTINKEIPLEVLLAPRLSLIMYTDCA